MRLSQIDLNLLVVFEAIYREQNLTRAAAQLHLTQPALSHALGRLRELFTDPLFSRSGRLMVPTAFARNLIGPVREALLTLERGLFSSDPFSPVQTSRRFTIGMIDLLETVWLPRLVGALQSEAPHMTFVTTRVMRRELEQELATGALDLAIDVSVPVSAAVRRAPLGSDRVVVVARRKHPELSDGLDLETYLRLPHVLVSTRRQGLGIEDVALQRIGRTRRVALRCQNHLAACHVVHDSELLLTMPERYAKLANLGLDNRLYPIPLEVAQLEVHMYWHASADNDAASTWLRERIKQVAATP